MSQKFYQKASVQVAIVSALVAIVIIAVHIWFNYSDVKRENRKLTSKNKTLSDDLAKASTEVQRIETLLTPFRTIALEKFTGDEKQALRKLADQITKLQTQDEAKTRQIESLQKELTEAISLAQPANLVLAGHKLEQTESGPKVILQFKPTKNERLGRIEFNVSLPKGSTATIKKIGNLYNPCIGEQTRISPDGKSAHDSFTLLGTGLPTFELVASGPTPVHVKGNYLETELELEVK